MLEYSVALVPQISGFGSIQRPADRFYSGIGYESGFAMAGPRQNSRLSV